MVTKKKSYKSKKYIVEAKLINEHLEHLSNIEKHEKKKFVS